MEQTFVASGILNAISRKNSRQHIDLLDKLNQNGLAHQIPTPKCVVIGDQSSGKSSTLENLSGLALPKGTGTVTKAALELELRSPNQTESEGITIWIQPSPDEHTPSNVPLHGSPRQIDEDQVAENIEMLTEKLIANNTVKFSKHTIVIRVVREGLNDLTLIDLPGMIRLGDGPEKALVDNLILHYIRQPEVIIIPVVPMNADIDTSACLNLSVEHDPSGERTLVALTKVDLIDKGAEKKWTPVLEHGYHKVPNIIGWYVVKNRSQQQVTEKLSLPALQEEEITFFSSTKPWDELKNRNSLGIKALATALSALQMERIKEFLPTIKEKVKEKLQITKEELKEFGEVVPQEKGAQMNKCLDIISDLCKDVRLIFDDNKEKEIWQMFHAEFEKFKNEIYESKKEVGTEKYESELKKRIKDFRGSELPLFPSYELAKSEIREIITTWKNPALTLLDTVMEALSNLAFQKVKQQVKRFPEFANIINKEINCLLESTKDEVAKRIDEILDSYVENPYTQNDYFEETVLEIFSSKFGTPDLTDFESALSTYVAGHGNAMTMETVLEIHESTVDSSPNLIELQTVQLQATIQAYVNVSYKNFTDSVPRGEILLRFNHRFKNDVEPTLREVVCAQDDTAKLLNENFEVKQKRIYLETNLKCLQTCMQILNESMI